MKPAVMEMLVCPACLPGQKRLKGEVQEAGADGDVIAGTLVCVACGCRYPIREGVAVLLPPGRCRRPPADSKYERDAVLAAYLWSHYADLFEAFQETNAYVAWSGMMQRSGGFFLDAGCAVGRLTFEMSRCFDMVVGVDLSRVFIQTARSLMQTRKATFGLPTEGRLTENRSFRLPAEWRCERVDFLVADATRLPFRSDGFTGLASLNILDKVPRPLMHLEEMDRVAAAGGAQFLFSDPFSWSKETALEEHWLGGCREGPFAGRGLENVTALLEGRKGRLRPWRIEETADIWWSIRNHENHFERIRSRTIKAVR